MTEQLTLFNQGWTVFLLVIIYYLFLEWWPGTKKALRTFFSSRQMSKVEWIMVAIMTSHVGFFLDNVYWLIAWSGKYLGANWGDTLTDLGIYANTVFRQGLGILAVWLHLYAARYQETEDEEFPMKQVNLFKGLKVAGIIAASFTGTLYVISKIF